MSSLRKREYYYTKRNICGLKLSVLVKRFPLTVLRFEIFIGNSTETEKCNNINFATRLIFSSYFIKTAICLI